MKARAARALCDLHSASAITRPSRPEISYVINMYFCPGDKKNACFVILRQNKTVCSSLPNQHFCRRNANISPRRILNTRAARALLNFSIASIIKIFFPCGFIFYETEK